MGLQRKTLGVGGLMVGFEGLMGGACTRSC